MKYLNIAGMLVLAGFAGHAVAQVTASTCTNAGYTFQLDATDIGTALTDTRVMAVDPSSSEEWNEDHCGGPVSGNLYKIGDGSAVDPRALRGTWTAGGNRGLSLVTYNYNVGGSSFWSWTLWSDTADPTTGGLCWETTSPNSDTATTAVAIDASPMRPVPASPCASSAP